ncbi:MAG: hypothetical protein C5B47_08315, partial [Verrucomicrobia bacterium]
MGEVLSENYAIIIYLVIDSLLYILGNIMFIYGKPKLIFNRPIALPTQPAEGQNLASAPLSLVMSTPCPRQEGAVTPTVDAWQETDSFFSPAATFDTPATDEKKEAANSPLRDHDYYM